MEIFLGLVLLALAAIGAVTSLRWLGGRRKPTKNQLHLIEKLRRERVADDLGLVAPRTRKRAQKLMDDLLKRPAQPEITIELEDDC